MDTESRIKDIIYKRKNGEPIVNDPAAIKSCKTEQSRDVIDNARLGSYDKYGNYVIIPDIKRELVDMPKLVYGVNHPSPGVTVYDLKGVIPIFGDMHFKLTLTKNEATLSLIESVNREAGGYIEVYEEPIDSVGYGANGLPQSIVFRNYHITDKPDDFGQRENYDYGNVLTRKVYLSLLSKELRMVSNSHEKQAYEQMVSTLKTGGEYGKRVLNEFVERLKERPTIFEIKDSDRYYKSLNEVLLSGLDIATTDKDKDDPESKATYLDVLNTRNQYIEEELKYANNMVDEKYVRTVVKKATDEFDQGLVPEGEEDVAEEFFSRISDDKRASQKRRSLEKPILKQGKESEEEKAASKAQTKEDKIKSILDKKEGDKKKTPAGKKLKASKGKTASKKMKAKKAGKKPVKGKGKKKGPKKAKLKNKKKKIKKAKSPAKAKAKVGKVSAKGGGGAKKKKKEIPKSKSYLYMLEKKAVEEDIVTYSNSNISELSRTPSKNNAENILKAIKKEAVVRSDYSKKTTSLRDIRLVKGAVKEAIERKSEDFADLNNNKTILEKRTDLRRESSFEGAVKPKVVSRETISTPPKHTLSGLGSLRNKPKTSPVEEAVETVDTPPIETSAEGPIIKPEDASTAKPVVETVQTTDNPLNHVNNQQSEETFTSTATGPQNSPEPQPGTMDQNPFSTINPELFK